MIGFGAVEAGGVKSPSTLNVPFAFKTPSTFNLGSPATLLSPFASPSAETRTTSGAGMQAPANVLETSGLANASMKTLATVMTTVSTASSVKKATQKDSILSRRASSIYSGTEFDAVLEPTGSIFEHTCVDVSGRERSLTEYRGKVCLIVNVSPRCGFSHKHFEELNVLHDRYASAGLCILAFPNLSFGAAEEVKMFTNKELLADYANTDLRYSFQMFGLSAVNGMDAIPLYHYLTQFEQSTDTSPCKMRQNRIAIKWNYTKFLCSRDGVPVRRFNPSETPLAFEDVIRAELEKEATGGNTFTGALLSCLPVHKICSGA